MVGAASTCAEGTAVWVGLPSLVAALSSLKEDRVLAVDEYNPLAVDEDQPLAAAEDQPLAVVVDVHPSLEDVLVAAPATKTIVKLVC